MLYILGIDKKLIKQELLMMILLKKCFYFNKISAVVFLNLPFYNSFQFLK